ncbi:GNAT family N-acetyltransferase [Tuberibacillus calidus]|uniref:GNAT family N-acetyltransferase n=1 Tax=Tuberibacillus calidus TaxID=340097 RepID=UPI0004873D37|nr:GNAT family N-acetyltransferase [Tuberibacillus calidus]
MNIRSFREEDWMQVKEIYEQGIATGQATFETTAPSFEKWESTIAANLCLVAENKEGIQGWCKISKVSDRCVYEGVGEVSVYVRDVSRGKGVGKKLLQAIIKESEAKGFWTLTAGIFPENIPSLRLHQSVGFREVGIRQRIGKLNGVWRDVKLLERRSQIVGID